MNKRSSGRTVDALVEKYRTAEREIARAQGPFSLFGLFRHEERPDKLDLIIAAPWLKTNRNGLLQIARDLPYLTPEEGSVIGRIVALEPDDPFVQELHQVADKYQKDLAAGEAVTFTAVPTPDFPVTEGWVIASRALPTPTPVV